MPIQVKDYVWEEADESVLVTVPLKGVPPNRVDVFSIDDYIKVYSIYIAFEQARKYCYCNDLAFIIDTVNGMSLVGELPAIHF